MTLEHVLRADKAGQERMRTTGSWFRQLPTEPFLPVLVLAPVALYAAAQHVTALCWAALTALAGYSLSGSV